MSRNYTYIVLSGFVYVRLKGLIWAYIGLTNPNNVDKSAGDALAEICTEIEPSIPLLIDCNGVSGITDHAWDSLFIEINRTKREIIFINYQKIEQKINLTRKELCGSMKIQNNDHSFIIYSSSIQFKLNSSYEKEIDDKITDRIKSYVDKSFHKYENDEMKLLASTPIYSNGEFDAANLVSNPEMFYWTTIRLADKVEEVIQNFRVGGMSNSPKLLTVSLRSSPFAAAIGLMLGLSIETVDHLGPIIKNFEVDYSTTNNEFIYIGDFAVGGTEIKISKTYALMRNSKLEHAIVIGSLFPDDVFKEFKLHSLISLQKSEVGVKYSLNPKE